MNVFPTREIYVNQFGAFIQAIPREGYLIYCAADARLQQLVEEVPHPALIPYDVPSYTVADGVATLESDGRYPLKVFGKHNMLNLMGAKCVCNQLGIADKQFFGAMTDFTGAGKRLQLLGKTEQTAVYLDFAHSPSKVEATIGAVKEQYPGRRLVACLELHTFSSLNRGFLGEYRKTMEAADTAVVYYNPETIRHKKLEMFPEEEVRQAFDRKGLLVFTARESLEQYLQGQGWKNAVLLLMSSGTFSGMNVQQMTERIING
jgi:UDP-N-acetylmuramate: L-alanyl-gamma-D-glutamyl-meso-diaminopimelate ligase